MSNGKIIGGAAKGLLATLVSGIPGADLLKSTGNAAIDAAVEKLTKTDTFKGLLAAVEARIEEGGARGDTARADDLAEVLVAGLSKRKTLYRDILAAGPDAGNLAGRVLDDIARGLDLDDRERKLCRDILAAFFAEIVDKQATIPAMSGAWQQIVHKNFAGLSQQVFAAPAATVAAFQAMLAGSALHQPAPRRFVSSDQHSSQTLLAADFQAVEFLPRPGLTDPIEAWCQAGPNIAVALHTGAGGLGKTRLFIEMARRLWPAGWRAGFVTLPGGPWPEWGWRALFEGDEPIFAVVDYAERRQDEAAALIAAAAEARMGGTAKVRVILLARSAADWWERFIREAPNQVQGILQATAIDERPVPPLALPERHAMLGLAVRDFARHLARTTLPPVQSVDLSDDRVFAWPLMVQIAALSLVETGALAGPDQDRLLQWVVDRNRGQLKQALAAIQETGAAVIDGAETAMAVATLIGGCANRQDETAVLAKIPVLAGLPPDRGAGIVDVLRVQHPKPAGEGEALIGPVLPDLVGEHLIGHVCKKSEAQKIVLDGAMALAAKPATPLTVLCRLAQRSLGQAKLLRAALQGRVRQYHEAVIEVGLQTGDPIGRIFAKILHDHPDAGVAEAIIDRLPMETTALIELGVEASQQFVVVTNGAPTSASEKSRERHAKAVDAAGMWLGKSGQREDALRASEEAILAYRRLAKDRPTTFRQDLARSLINVSVNYFNLNRRDDAIMASREAVSITRELAVGLPNAFLPDLASSLNNLGAFLLKLDRREEALKIIEEAVSIRRKLASDLSDAFLPDLASSLNNLAVEYSILGQHEKALNASEEALSIRRKLAQDRPDAFLPHLALSLTNIGPILFKLARYGDSVTASEEAVSIRRKLTKNRPDIFLPDLATSLNNLSAHLTEVGQIGDALVASKEAVDIRRKLASDHPGIFSSELASCLINVSKQNAALNRHEDGLEAAQEALSIYRELAERQVGAYLPEIATSLKHLGVRYSELGRHEEALLASKDAVSIFRQLNQKHPDSFLEDLAESLNNLGKTYSDLGKREDALATTEEAVSVFLRLAIKLPDKFRFTLALSLDNLGNMLSDVGRYEDALRTSKEAVSNLRQLSPTTAGTYWITFANSLHNLSIRHSEFRQWQDALVAAEEAVSIFRRLTRDHIEAVLPNLATSLSNLSTVHVALGHHAEALPFCEEAAQIFRDLSNHREDIFLPGLAMSLNNLSSRYSKMQRHEDALSAAENSVAIYRKLAEKQPDIYLPDLATSVSVHGHRLHAMGRSDLAAANYVEAVRLLKEHFLALPTAHVRRMGAFVRDYYLAAETLRIELDNDLLLPIVLKLGEIGALDPPRNPAPH